MHSAMVPAALLASAAAASSVGSAIVLNKCNYDVYVCNTPASGGGYSQIDKTLSNNETYEQEWTELSNAQGWSIKLSKDTSLSNIMQYEYTFHDDGTIWYDLSDVNGNPWDGNWEITASNEEDDCDPKDQAYRYATDDAYGMQACSQDSVITVTLCSGESQDDGGAASASSSVASVTSAAGSTYSTPASATPSVVGAVTTSSASPESSASSSSSSTNQYSSWGHAHEDDKATPSSSATTFSTLTSSASSALVTNFDGVIVTEVDTAIVTEIITATAYQRFRRDHHHQHHGHVHNYA